MARASRTIRTAIESRRRALPEQAVTLNESGWLRIVKLLVQLCYLSFKACVLRLQFRFLSLKRRNLLREKHGFLFQKVDYIFAESGGAANPNDFLRGIECSHDSEKV